MNRLKEAARTALEFSVGAGSSLWDELSQRLNPFSCGETVLGTGTVHRTSAIFLHDHDTYNPITRETIPCPEGKYLAAYDHPTSASVVELYDPQKHGPIDWWLDQQTVSQRTGDPHTHYQGACTL